MSLGGEENRDPTVDAALEVLKRPRIQTPLPALRGSGVAAAGPTPYEDYLRTWGNVAPEVTTASAVAPAPPDGGGPDGYSDSSTNPAWDAMSMSEKAAYYADNPTAGKIGRVVNDYFSNTPYGMMQNYFDPGIQTQTDAIMAGMDPTGWQFAGRNNDGIFGTQIGGTLSFPQLSPENFGPYAFPTETAPAVTSYAGSTSDPYAGTFLNTPEALAWASTPAVAPVMTDGVTNTTPVVSVSDFMANVANQADDPMDALMGQLSAPAVQPYTTVNLSSGPAAGVTDAPYGGYVTDGSKNAVIDGNGNPVAYGEGHAIAAAAQAAANAQAEAEAQAEANANGEADAAACCFIMLEARYGDGTMDNVVRKYRDEMMTDKNRRGYYKLAEVLVPLMRKSAVFKFIVQKTFADPLVSYGKWHYKENKHGWVFAPIKSMWMKVFDVLGGDTEFIRENGQVV